MRSATTTVLLLASASCLPAAGPGLILPADDAGIDASSAVRFPDDAAGADVDLGLPFAATGMNPSHGPFAGGTRTMLRGRGFGSSLRVWIGSTELTADAVVASDPTHALLVTPPGLPGPADVRIRNEAMADGGQGQEQMIEGAFVYDPFVIEPAVGVTGGGTRIAITGSGTTWTAETVVYVGAVPCDEVTVLDTTRLVCTTRGGAPGARDVRVVSPGGADQQVREAFTYQDATDGFRGGLTGGPLQGELRVFAFDSYQGKAIPGAQVIVGASPVVATSLTDAAGVVTFRDGRLVTKATVTVAARCFQPVTFVDVPVDTLTTYLSPRYDAACASGDPSYGSGYVPHSTGVIGGELVWPGQPETRRQSWINVPSAVRPTERVAAYVYEASSYPNANFWLPSSDAAVTPDSPGILGYQYTVGTWPGAHTLYALAGIEDRTTSRFTAYAMGVVRAIVVEPNATVTGVDLTMDIPFDQVMSVHPVLPAPVADGPDRVVAELSVTLGSGNYAVLPVATATALLPLTSDLVFRGVPALEGALAGEAYRVTVRLLRGPSGQGGTGGVATVVTRDPTSTIGVDKFPPAPKLLEPGNAPWGAAHVAYQTTGTWDLAVLTIVSGGGLASWTLVAPAGVTEFDVPDLSNVPERAGLLRGPIRSTLNVARLDGFTYGKLRTGQLVSSAWTSSASDSTSGTY